MSEFTSGTLTATATVPSGINNSASQLVINTVGYGAAVFTIGQGSTGSASFFASGDGGVNWSPLLVMPSNAITAVTTASAPGLWQANPGAYTHVSMVATAVSGGGLNTSIHISTVAAFDGGGGGGPGGMVPAGSTGIVSSLFTTTGSSGASTYSPSTGALNIPIYTGGGGGMVPAGSTGIVNSLFTTTGASGASTYNPSTGALNIPIYAPGTINQLSTALSSSIVGTSISTTVVSTGFGMGPFTALFNPLVLVCFNWNVQMGGTNNLMYAPIYRTTGTIPVLNATIPGGDVELIRPRTFVGSSSGVTTIAGTFLDTSLLVGTAYRYYLGWYATTPQNVTVFAAPVGTPSLQVVELK